MTSIPPKTQRRLCRLLSAHTDMRFSLHAAFLTERAETLDDKYHQFLSMVICYARPFTENRDLGSITVEYPAFPDHTDAELNCAHDRLMTLRHQFLSHSSAAASKVLLVFPGAVNPATDEVSSCPTFVVAKRTFVDPRFVRWLAVSVEAFKLRLERDIAVHLERLSLSVPAGTLIEIDTGADEWKWPE